SRFGNDYVNQNDHRESDLYNRFHQRNREIIFCVILNRVYSKIICMSSNDIFLTKDSAKATSINRKVIIY
ncbi:MAG: hypothetical protein ACI8YQ_005198, partial [Polaribacter sp.]